MSVTELIDSYFAMWNETDAKRRKDLVARTWTDDATYVDPQLEGTGHSGIDAMVQGVHAQFPGHKFRRTGEIEAHHDRVRFTWELGPESGPVLVSGTDFGVVANSRLKAITGFFDKVNMTAAE